VRTPGNGGGVPGRPAIVCVGVAALPERNVESEGNMGNEGSRSIERLIEGWDGTAVVVRLDRPTGTWIFVALHDATLGPAVGGTRLKVYPRKEDGLRDAMRLAEGMTHKWAVIEFPFGGGKAVLAPPRELARDEREGLLERYAGLLNALAGAFSTGQDLGTAPADMAFLARRTKWVHGIDPRSGEMGDPGPFTARGVLEGILAACEQRFGSPELSGRTILVQGVGDVGAPLARLVTEAGATVLVSDLDAARAAAVADELGGRTVAPEEVYATECDVYAPCAVGATLNEGTIPSLRCAIVAGSANNQLAEEADAERLHERGILYAPDYVVNAGGATAFGALAQGVFDEAEMVERVLRLRGVTAEILGEAQERGESPLRAARRRVERVLAAARA